MFSLNLILHFYFIKLLQMMFYFQNYQNIYHSFIVNFYSYAYENRRHCDKPNVYDLPKFSNRTP